MPQPLYYVAIKVPIPSHCSHSLMELSGPLNYTRPEGDRTFGSKCAGI